MDTGITVSGPSQTRRPIGFNLLVFLSVLGAFYILSVKAAASGVETWPETVSSEKARIDRGAFWMAAGVSGEASASGRDLPLEITALWAVGKAGAPVFPLAAGIFHSTGEVRSRTAASKWAEKAGETIAGPETAAFSTDLTSPVQTGEASVPTRGADDTVAAFLYRTRTTLDQVPVRTNQLVIRHFSGHSETDADISIGVVRPDGTVDTETGHERLSGGAFSFDYQFRSGAGTYLFGLYIDDGQSPWDDLVFPIFVENEPSGPAVTGHLLESSGKSWMDGLDTPGAIPSELSETLRRRINEIRRSHGVSETLASVSLTTAASLNARDMSESGVLTHRSDLRGGVQARLAEVDPDHSHAAELVSRGATIGGALARILVSPRYRAGLLDPLMTHAGAGVCKARDGRFYLCVNLIRSHEPISPTAASGMVLGLLNRVRDSSGAKPLKEEMALSDIAYRHACAMAEAGRVTSRPSGVDVSSEIRAMSTVFSKIRLKIYSSHEPESPERGDIDDPELTHAGVGVVRGKARGGEKVYFVSIIMGVARKTVEPEEGPSRKSAPRKGRGATKKPGSK